jgi:hypothetical protein
VLTKKDPPEYPERKTNLIAININININTRSDNRDEDRIPGAASDEAEPVHHVGIHRHKVILVSVAGVRGWRQGRPFCARYLPTFCNLLPRACAGSIR